MEEFHDALEELPPRKPSSLLADSIEHTRHAMNLFFNNQFEEAVAFLEPRANDSMYHSLGFATTAFIQALMTCNDHDVEKAMNATKHASDVCDKYRKPNNLAGRLTTFGSSNVEEDHFTDVQLHAELCYAEALLERALLTFVQDENLISFLKGAIRIRSCYQSYKKCQQHMYSHSWQDDAVRSHFESGVKLGDGTFSLLISALPSRVLKLLEFAGFNGNRDYGLRQLKSAALMHYTLRWPLSALVLLVWNLNFVYILGTGESDLLLSEKLILDMLSIYPASSLVLFFSGRYAEITGDFAKAIQLFQSSIDQQTEWRQFHHLCFWELIFCHSFLRDWRKARQYAEALYAENKWSRSTYAYLSACCLMSEIGIGERSTQEGAPTDETVETILHLMRQVPLLKVKLSGKSLPVEKFCMAKSNQFFSQNNSLFIPLYELLYFWNCYTCIGRNESAVLSILDDIERQYQRRKSTCAEGMSADDHCLYLLLKAMCLKQLQSPFQAEQLLLEIVNKKQDLKVNTYLAPNAYLELALLRLDNRKSDLAKQFVLKAKEFKGYLLESRVHFRRSDARLNYRSWRGQRLVRNLLSNYIFSVRPATSEGPVRVHTSVFFSALNAVDEYKMEFKAQFKFQQEWFDSRLKFHDGYFGKDKFIHLSSDQIVWVPDTFVPNEKSGAYHLLDQPNQYLKIRSDGKVIYNKRLTMTLACVMHLARYPMDEQTCFLDFVSYAYTTADILYEWSNPPLHFEKYAFSGLSNFEVKEYRNSSCTSQTATGNYSCLRVELKLRRLFSFFMLQVYVPSSLLVAVSWVSYWIDWRAAAGRVPLSIITLLTMITHSHAINANLPPVSYAKALDVWVGGCVMFIFVSLIEYAFVNYAGLREQCQVAEMKTNVDQSQFAIPQWTGLSAPTYADQGDGSELHSKRRRRKQKSNAPVRPPASSCTVVDEECGGSVTELVSSIKEKRRKRLLFRLFSLRCLERLPSRADRIDNVSRYLLPFLFCSFNIVYWSVYWSGRK
uniref:Ig-like domain-containing protein n=1 Tax=Trichuris muris TaxID=70415 RepID=A0A5S6Q917_TRIMR